MEAEVNKLVLKAYKAENKILDWIFEEGELDFLPKEYIQEFLKERFNNSLRAIGFEKIFEVNEALLEPTEWFDEEVLATKHVDFFVKRSINYNKKSKPIS
jgi:ribonucleoside-diphosphate reductase beta chain